MSNRFSIRDVLSKYSQFNNLSIADTALPPGLENLCSEVYNSGREVMTFTSTHPDRHRMFFFSLPPDFWNRLECKPGEWVFLPHSQYIMTVPSGNQAYQSIQNFGDAMFKGNTLPSRPEAAKIRSFVK